MNTAQNAIFNADQPIPYAIVEQGDDAPIPYSLADANTPLEFCTAFVYDEPAVTAAE